MTSYRSDFLHQAQARGFIHQGTDLCTLDQRLNKGPCRAYAGFDASGPSLHVGSLVQMMLLRLFQETGHEPIILLGGGTTKVGDPSGKDATRPILSPADLQKNMRSLAQPFQALLDLPPEAYVNNGDWLDSLGYLDFLNEVGRHFSVNRMLTFDSVRLRLEREQPLSFLEFNYMLLQSYDFLHLFRQHDCCIQFGGADQWGNIVSGVDLIRRLQGAQAFGVTTPLITTAGGGKMGKTASGAVWLNADKLSLYDYWQFWRNTHDGDVGRFLRLFTTISLDEIGRIEALEGAELNAGKVLLADKATHLLHGAEALTTIHATTAAVFIGEASENPSALPAYTLPPAAWEGGVSILECLEKTELVTSKSEARRLIRGGGVRLEGQLVTDEGAILYGADFRTSPTLKLACGRKKHALLRRE